MNSFFSEVNKNFGFGCMRLPMKLAVVDSKEFSEMIDTFISSGFNYFDTAHGYLAGQSETAIRECLAKRYPRDKFILTDKLTSSFFKSEEDIRPFFEKQLKACGVDYFDFYLLHSVTANNYKKFERCHAFKVLRELRDEGKIKHIGFSFHDKPQLLDRILAEHPETEVVQIQFNYADYDNPGIESYGCYQVCEKYGKPVIVMEPVKGGGLVNLPDEAKKTLDSLGGYSYAGYAIRFAASFPNIFMVISGMGNMDMMNDNISAMKDFKPLSNEELKAIDKVRDILKKQNTIQCTECRYCVDGCPKNIRIPDLFSCYNTKKQFKGWNSHMYYKSLTASSGKAKDCVKCGKCEQICPQHLPVRKLLKKVSRRFDILPI